MCSSFLWGKAVTNIKIILSIYIILHLLSAHLSTIVIHYVPISIQLYIIIYPLVIFSRIYLAVIAILFYFVIREPGPLWHATVCYSGVMWSVYCTAAMVDKQTKLGSQKHQAFWCRRDLAGTDWSVRVPPGLWLQNDSTNQSHSNVPWAGLQLGAAIGKKAT